VDHVLRQDGFLRPPGQIDLDQRLGLDRCLGSRLLTRRLDGWCPCAFPTRPFSTIPVHPHTSVTRPAPVTLRLAAIAGTARHHDLICIKFSSVHQASGFLKRTDDLTMSLHREKASTPMYTLSSYTRVGTPGSHDRHCISSSLSDPMSTTDTASFRSVLCNSFANSLEYRQRRESIKRVGSRGGSSRKFATAICHFISSCYRYCPNFSSTRATQTTMKPPKQLQLPASGEGLPAAPGGAWYDSTLYPPARHSSTCIPLAPLPTLACVQG